MHLEELLARYVDTDMAIDEKKRVEDHLEQCAYCRSLAQAFRKIDAAMSRASAPPSGWPALEKKVKRTVSFYRVFLIIAITWAVASGIAGITLMLVNGDSGPLWVALIAISLIADAPLLGYIGYLVAKRYKALELATRSWESMRAEWKRHLEDATRHLRSRLRWMPLIWFGMALVFGISAALRASVERALWALFPIAVCFIDTIQTRRTVGSLTREKEALDRLEIEASESD